MHDPVPKAFASCTYYLVQSLEMGRRPPGRVRPNAASSVRRTLLESLPLPIVQAPLSGGASTPELTIAATRAGALGILAAGYLTTEGLRESIHRVRGATASPFGVNLFVPDQDSGDPAALHSYGERVRAEASRVGAEPGVPKWSDDEWQSKLDLVLAERPAVVSFTFGCPERGVFGDLHRAGIEAWVTVTEPDEAELAAQAGADALVVQGFEAGGHRASFVDQDGVGELGLLTLIRLVSRRVRLPLIAAGGICDGYAVAAVLVAGARAAQVGSMFLDTIEAGTSAPHRKALRSRSRTALTRAFSGKRARGIVNGFMARNAKAPAAYPQVHYLTAPMRAEARARGEADLINLWAGQGYELMEHGVPAERVIERMAAELEDALVASGRTARRGSKNR
jgi:nitronate monooxygenase